MEVDVEDGAVEVVAGEEVAAVTVDAVVEAPVAAIVS